MNEGAGQRGAWSDVSPHVGAGEPFRGAPSGLAPPVLAPPPPPPMPVAALPASPLPVAAPLSPAELPVASPPPLAMPVAAPAPPPASADAAEEEGDRRDWGFGLVPGLISMMVHLVAFIVLALCVVSGGPVDRGHVSLAATSGVPDVEPLESDELLLEPPDPGLRIRLEGEITLDVPALEPAGAERPEPEQPKAAPVEPVAPRGDLLSSVPQGKPGPARGKPGGAGDRLGAADSIEDAVGSIIEDIEREMAKGELLVVWMLDASISLLEDRPKVARKLETLFERAAARAPKDSHLFMNAAVAFGSQALEMVPPTKLNRRVVAAVEQVPTDQSGQENTMGAVQWVVQRYGKRWHNRILVVVWTDEAGDDTFKLEETIKACLKRDATVSVIGPSAILGRQDGVQSWSFPGMMQVHYLPVCRGPDSALPERLMLPYWHRTQLPAWRRVSAQAGLGVTGPDGLPPWCGGSQLEGMVSGFGPYALTRLALETGGTYTIMDRPADRGPFRLKELKPYEPDYRAHGDILEDLRYHPLRKAVLDAVYLLSQRPVETPQMAFLSRGAAYCTPAEFRDGLRRLTPRQQAIAQQGFDAVDAALRPFGREGLETDYAAEESPRWRAWYDLTRGRLLAFGVRCREYQHALASLPYVLHPGTNHVEFDAWPDLRLAPTLKQQAEEAERLLRRCVEQNPDTPWAYLAQRELDHGLGIAIGQSVIPPPPPKLPTPAVPMMPHAPGARPAAPTLPRL